MSYSQWKAAHYHQELAQFKAGEFPYPRQLQIDPFNPCNHDCPFCVYRYHKDDTINALFNVNDVIPFDKLVDIFDSCVAMGTRAVELTGGGEPTLHPRIIDIFDAVITRKLELALITNGCGKHWKRETTAMCASLAGHAAWVRFSLNAATPETHAVVHRTYTGDFWNAVRSIGSLVKRKKQDNGGCVIGISFVVTVQNVHEIKAAAKLALDLGVDNIRFTPAVFDADPIQPENQPPDEGVMHKGFDAAMAHATDSFSVFTERSRAHHQTAFGDYVPGDVCYYSHLKAVIGADLNLYPCCVLKYRPEGRIVSLADQTFQQAWESGERRRYYDQLAIDTQCKTCFLKPKNDFIKYLVSETPAHVNFL